MSKKHQFKVDVFTGSAPLTGYKEDLPKRHRIARNWLSIFLLSTIVGIIALSALLLNIINDSAGYVAYKDKKDPAIVWGGVPPEELSHAQLDEILKGNISANRYRTIGVRKFNCEPKH